MRREGKSGRMNVNDIYSKFVSRGCWQEKRIVAEHTKSRRSEMKMTLRICFRRLGGTDEEAMLK